MFYDYISTKKWFMITDRDSACRKEATWTDIIDYLPKFKNMMLTFSSHKDELIKSINVLNKRETILWYQNSEAVCNITIRGINRLDNMITDFDRISGNLHSVIFDKPSTMNNLAFILRDTLGMHYNCSLTLRSLVHSMTPYGKGHCYHSSIIQLLISTYAISLYLPYKISFHMMLNKLSGKYSGEMIVFNFNAGIFDYQIVKNVVKNVTDVNFISLSYDDMTIILYEHVIKDQHINIIGCPLNKWLDDLDNIKSFLENNRSYIYLYQRATNCNKFKYPVDYTNLKIMLVAKKYITKCRLRPLPKYLIMYIFAFSQADK